MSSAIKLIPESFTPAPSLSAASPEVVAVAALGPELDAIGFAIGSDGTVPTGIGLSRESLALSGFEGKSGQTLLIPVASGPTLLAVGVGGPKDRTAAKLRDAAAGFARAASRHARIGFELGDAFALEPQEIGRLVTEGALLARYRYTILQAKPANTPLELLEIAASDDTDAVTAGIATGIALADAANLARDLANTPPGHLTATDFADLAVELAPRFGLAVTVYDKQALIELGCGGLLGVNAASSEEPRMIVLEYAPEAPTAHLALVGKGIMYDSGGISLKPSDPMHLLMKMDMGGAASVFAAMTALQALGSTTRVTGYLMCTDNMPSGSATKLGDVLTIHGGTTVEVKNTDAEGRLVMSDALVLASELKPDAIVDIATLTGAALMALGPSTAALFANDDALAAEVVAASADTDEQVWQLPLEHRYRDQLKSDVADISNLGGRFAGATTAALFLAEFVGETPWAHLDIAGTMQVDADDSWRPKGATGFGTRLLIELALRFTPTGPATE